MKFTLSWLNQFVPTDALSPALIADKLTMLGLEVDSVQELFAELDQIITARVNKVERHPNADKLTVCEVETGKEIVEVVCGAPNVRAGMMTALARPGTKLPDGTKIKQAKVRGVSSAGMLCSARELGINDDHGGILDLDGTLVPGVPVAQALGLRDTVIEVDLTPNRPDCASVRGIAREVGGFTGHAIRPLVPHVTPLNVTHPDYKVIIEDQELCPRYTARKLSNVSIGPSPLWMQQRLNAVGMRPINNIVDITNYVMLESGQPLHAFDFTTLKQAAIVVRRPRAGESTLTTLDGSERQLHDDTLLICDAERPVAVAGVMGGLETEITEQTRTILIESACFNPVSIRRTARRLGLPSESSYRFERGVDPELAASALERAVNLMVEFAGASPDASGIDLFPGRKAPLKLTLRVERVCSLLGMTIAQDEVARLLRGIEFPVHSCGDGILEVVVPSFRIDIEREIDLVEEVARLVGYNEIPTSQPTIRMDYPKRDELRSLRQEVARILTAQGFFEAINYSFVDENHLDLCLLSPDDSRRQVTRLLNPLAEDQGVMRSLLLPGLLENIRRNINFQRGDIRLFETGKVFLQRQENALPEERMMLTAVISGSRYPGASPLHFADQMADVLDIKGATIMLLSTLRIVGQGGCPLFHQALSSAQPYGDPVRSLVITDGNKTIGTLGAVHPETLKGFGIKQDVFYVEIDLELLLGLDRQPKQFVSLPRYPSVRRDTSLVVPESTPAGNLLRTIAAQKQKYIESTDIFDVYRGKPIQTGYKSVAVSVTYRSATSTLDDQSVDTMHAKIVKALMTAFDARYREGFEE